MSITDRAGLAVPLAVGTMLRSSATEEWHGRGKARLPPRWFVVTFWHVHRWVVRASGGRKGLWPPRPGKWGALRLTTTGRRSGEPRGVILGYYEDGPNLVTMAMNGWGARARLVAEPASPSRGGRRVGGWDPA